MDNTRTGGGGGRTGGGGGRTEGGKDEGREAGRKEEEDIHN